MLVYLRKYKLKATVVYTILRAWGRGVCALPATAGVLECLELERPQSDGFAAFIREGSVAVPKYYSYKVGYFLDAKGLSPKRCHLGTR